MPVDGKDPKTAVGLKTQATPTPLNRRTPLIRTSSVPDRQLHEDPVQGMQKCVVASLPPKRQVSCSFDLPFTRGVISLSLSTVYPFKRSKLYIRQSLRCSWMIPHCETAIAREGASHGWWRGGAVKKRLVKKREFGRGCFGGMGGLFQLAVWRATKREASEGLDVTPRHETGSRISREEYDGRVVLSVREASYID